MTLDEAIADMVQVAYNQFGGVGDADAVVVRRREKRKMKVYISGKITGLVYEDALSEFMSASSYLAAQGHEPVNPMTANGLDGDGNEHSWEEYMKRDIPLLLQCDAIFLLPSWADSRGAILETYIAQVLKIKIITDPRPKLLAALQAVGKH